MVSEMAPTYSARPLGETTYGRGPQAWRLTLQAEGGTTSLPYELEEEGSVASPPESESPFS